MVLIEVFDVQFLSPHHKTRPSICSTEMLNSERSSPLQGHDEGRKLVADGNEKLSLQLSTPRKCTCNFLELYKCLTFNKNDVK